MDGVFDWIKGIAAALGLFGTLYKAWDSLLSARPKVSFAFETLPEMLRPKLCFRVENSSRHEIIIDDIEYDRDRFQHFLKPDGMEAVLIWTGKPRRAFIKPGEVRLISLSVPDDFLNDEADLRLNATVRWRRHGSMLLQGWPVKLSTSNELLRAMQRDRSKRRDD